jgi:hypothetical protein
MLTGVQIKNLQKYPSIRHIFALRSESLRKLLESGNVLRSLLNEMPLAEIVYDNDPDERLIV